ncbi:protein btn-1-like [Stylophora pistillata]|uniref:Battenin n=1 Tax=Stylophora pistillata TaxID=50429 RepID=A0A2B4STG5_STYPI|nr:protein btn-1-like [Stylophora pistillata]PFX31777.1 Protein btn-1 [Stylophora pistillata]
MASVQTMGDHNNLKAEKETTASDTKSLNWLNISCFYIFGIISFFNVEMFSVAAQDILSGRDVPTAILITCYEGPLLMAKLVIPWFQEKIPYVAKMFFIASFMILGLSLVVFANDFRAKILGVMLNAMAAGACEATSLALASFYPKICISTFVAGTGSGCLIGALYYTVLTTWTCVSPKITMMMVIPLPLAVLMSYALLSKDYLPDKSQNSSEEHKQVKYSIVGSTPDTMMDQEAPTRQKLTCDEMLKIAWKMSSVTISLFLSFLAEYISAVSVVTTISFPNSHFLPRDHFLIYLLSYFTGRFVGRGYLLLFAWLLPDENEFLHCNKTWIFTMLQMAQLTLLIFNSLYHFFTYIWIIICICSTLGLVGGMMCVNAPHAIAQHVESEEREFALGLMSAGSSSGVLVGALIGLAVESSLRKHCVEHYPNIKEFCFTRYHNTTGWETNIHC